MKILLWDNGLCTELAVTLEKAGHTVGYSTPWSEAFPRVSRGYIGYGLGKKLTLESSFTDALQQYDMVIVPDTYSQERVLQAKLARKRVWGAGKSEQLELDRPRMKRIQAKQGMEVGPYALIRGLDALIKHLQDSEDRWIKTSLWRQYETFHHKEWLSTKVTHLPALLEQYGPVGEEMVFISEEPIKGVEVGIDGFFTQGQWLRPVGYGYEVKGEGYLGVVPDKLPKQLEDVCQRFTTPLTELECNSFVSIEMKVTARSAVPIEPTTRIPFPPGLAMSENYDMNSILVNGATASPPRYKYMATIIMHATHAADHWLEVGVKDPNKERFVKWKQQCLIKGKRYMLPGNANIGEVIGLGDTAENAVRRCKQNLEYVECRKLEANPGVLDTLLNDTVPEGQAVGLPFA